MNRREALMSIASAMAIPAIPCDPRSEVTARLQEIADSVPKEIPVTIGDCEVSRLRLKTDVVQIDDYNWEITTFFDDDPDGIVIGTVSLL